MRIANTNPYRYSYGWNANADANLQWRGNARSVGHRRPIPGRDH
jgi:hypothetical protein